MELVAGRARDAAQGTLDFAETHSTRPNWNFD